ncbi:MAG TPA: prepilin-type N-terminal cleavage/methylation domain-containing protein [Negativicutes bacterium]|nr:prepilin-type N-terminal cleavage/methylation domain-containing protein [Negativicutes bacterium]
MLRRIREMFCSQKGFTLVELMAVIAIIGVLVAISVPRYVDATKEANVAKVQADLSSIDSAVSMYYAANGTYPTAMTDLATYFDTTPTPPKDSYTIDGTTHRAVWNEFTADQRANIKSKL